MKPAMRDFIAELKRRKVIRIAIAYLAVSWVILQVGSMVIPAFNIPAWTLRLLVLLVVLGLPLALVLAWVYALTPAGLVREPAHPQHNRPDTAASTPSADASPFASEPHANASSIAVLPFTDMSQARDQEFFSDGLSEELINLLAKVPGLHVAGRTSSFSFKGKDTIITAVGKALNVAHVLEGSVRKSGDHLRITAQLIKVADDFHLWSETYDRQLTDIFEVQDEIASSVVAALKLKLLPGQLPTSSQLHTPGPDAYTQFLLGRHYLNRGTPEGFQHAVEAYGRAVELEPDYAMAYAGLALAQYAAAGYSDDASVIMQGQQLAMAAAEQAVLHDPTLTDAYAARGYLRGCYSWDWIGAQADFTQALALNPVDETTYERYARLLASLGRLPEAIAAARKPIESDPLSSRAWYVLGRFEAAQGNLASARQALNRALALAPEHAYGPLDLGLVSLLEGNPQAALAEFMRAPLAPFRLAGLAMAEHDLGHAAESQHALDALIATHADGYAYQIAEAYAWRGEPDDAFAWLDRACAQRDAGLQRVKYDPALRSLSGDPRYPALLKKLGLPQ